MSGLEFSELKLNLDPQSSIPYYKQIIHQIEMAITNKKIKSGFQLPTVRSLAVQLKINPNTVARAYTELEIRGIVNTHQGSGTYIADKTIRLSETEKEKILSEIVRDFLAKINSYGFGIQDVLDYLASVKGSNPY